jgi:plasmid stabilization system protein ParE
VVIIWTYRAKKQLKQIFNYYLEVAGRPIAKKIVTDMRNATKPLLIFPQMAAVERALVGYPYIYRSLVVRKIFKIVYKVEDNTIYIITVWNCQQNPDKLQYEI